MSQRFPPITPARLDWQADVPIAPDFDDPYFSRDDGPAETRHVFLQGNRLSERFRALPACARFVIGETGFGTGLNFLCAAQAFLDDAPADATLHFVSVEKHPLGHGDLCRAVQHWPAFAELAAELTAHYPPLTPGFHRLSLSGGRIVLTLIFADALAALAATDARMDAWFLDGFAPARNPAMWQPALFQQLARLSAPGASVATFTAAGFVRRGLIAEGFAMQRVPGFGRKREMLTGHFTGAPAGQNITDTSLWQPQSRRVGHAAIIGAGLAGATCARALAEQGWRVTVLDPAGIANGASGNLAGVVYTTPSAHATPQNRFYQSSYLHTLHWLARHGFPANSDQGALTGVLQYPAEPRHHDKQQAALDSGHWPAALLSRIEGRTEGRTENGRGITLSRGGYISPPAWCAHLLDHPLISLQQQAVRALAPADDGGWTLGHDSDTDLNKARHADIVVLANAGAARDLAGLHWLPLKLIRGQVTYCQATDASQSWTQAICHSGYLTPAIKGLHCVGATFDLRRHDLDTDPDDDRRNLSELQHHLPEHWRALGGEQTTVSGQRVGLRCQSTDFLPLAGPVPDATDKPHRHLPGLYMSIAHGSRGITGSTLCAELIAALVNDEPRPTDDEIVRALAPERFILRQRKKQPEWIP
ncbi:MAG: bifunctional tRNA (5-methylaminomethyl-2-thiouridine)(34)-methyltransferase MnmD/FAD-dependent 5-carboxymethylaminomethyl-2-thiouridine(34) oxidoreductase MnmC [Alcanivorax sp.]|nr:bifunctional tRNA (5-methylaminomethyl-2-thiouridine)(34)-methyltransferase MnmD/FAD-dependent 5-carboxymethylaminomethyl-2-thiouridine(34) oxidoreductase MnmC [Alcanivorax sp.]